MVIFNSFLYVYQRVYRTIEAKLYTDFSRSIRLEAADFRRGLKSEISKPSELALAMLDEANYSLCYVNSELMVVNGG